MKIIITLIIILLISGCGNTEEPVPTSKTVVEVAPKEPVKTYEFSIVNKEIFVNDLCAVTSRVKNIDDITHRYRITSYIIVNGVREELAEEFNLDAGRMKQVTRDIRCPLGSENTLNAEIVQIK